VLSKTNEVESQFYLTTRAVNKTRHTERFARFYGRLGREPLPIKRFCSGYHFQSASYDDDYDSDYGNDWEATRILG